MKPEAKISEVPPMQGLELEDEDVNNSMHLITQWFKSVTLKEFMDNLGDNYTPVWNWCLWYRKMGNIYALKENLHSTHAAFYLFLDCSTSNSGWTSYHMPHSFPSWMFDYMEQLKKIMSHLHL